MEPSIFPTEADITPHLLKIVTDKSIQLKARAEAASILSNRKTEEVVNTLVSLLTEEESVLTREAMVSLGEIGNPRASPHLEAVSFESGNLEATRLEVIKVLQRK